MRLDVPFRRFRSPARLIALTAIAMGCTTVAWARSSTPISLVTTGCGSLAELNERIATRSSRIRLVNRSGQVRGLEAEIRDLGANQKEVVLTVVKTARDRLSRRVRAQTCEEALEALALLTVLTLDPQGAVTPHRSGPRPAAKIRKEPEESEESEKESLPEVRSPPASAERSGTGEPLPPSPNSIPPPPDNTTSLESPDARAPIAPRRAHPTENETRPEIPDRVIARTKIEDDARRSRSDVIAVGAGGFTMGGPTPRSLAGGSVYAFWGWDRDSLWSPAIIVSAGHSARNGLAFPEGTANFSLDAVQVDLCPLSLGMRRRLGARACALGMAGALAASGVQTEDAETHRRFFALFGGSLAAIYQPGWRVELVASGSVGFPLQRYAFQFDAAVFHRVEAVSLTVGLGVGLRFH